MWGMLTGKVSNPDQRGGPFAFDAAVHYDDFWSLYVMLGPDPSIAISIHHRQMARKQPIRAGSDPRVEPEDDDGVLKMTTEY
jgi:hypothetical protein